MTAAQPVNLTGIRTISVMGDICRVLATGAQTSGRYSLMETIVPPGGGPPPHIHTREDEGFFILEGALTFYRAGERLVLEPGQFVSLPSGTAHCFRNESDRPVKMLVTIAPAGLEEMFFQFGVALADGALTAEPPTAREIELLRALAPDYGVEILWDAAVTTPPIESP